MSDKTRLESWALRARDLEMELRVEIDGVIGEGPHDAAGADVIRSMLNAEAGFLRAYASLQTGLSILSGHQTSESMAMYGRGVGLAPWSEHNRRIGESIGMDLGPALENGK